MKSFYEQWCSQGQNKRHALFLEMEREYRAEAKRAVDPVVAAQWRKGAERMAARAAAEAGK
jgi:hypothetical protein